MSSEHKKKTGSFTEDGINFWRNPRSPNGSYLAQYRLSNGKKKCIGCGTNEFGKAYTFACKKREQHEHDIAGTGKSKLITIDNLCAAFLKEKRKLGLKPDTLKMLKSMTHRIRGYRLCHLKGSELPTKIFTEKSEIDVPKLIDRHIHAHKLTQTMFDNFVDEMHENVQSSGTLRALIGRLSSMFDWAKTKGYAVPDIDFKKWNRKIKHSLPRERRLQDEELDKLLDWLKHKSNRGKHNYYRLLCCSELGLRIGEVCSIKVGGVDTNKKSIRVARKKKKTEIYVELRMTDHLASELEKYIEKLPTDQLYLFQGKKGGPMSAGSAWFRKACVECDIHNTSDGPLVLHCARAKFITDQLDEDRTLPKIMASVGHKRISTTMRYIHMTGQKSQAEAVELSNKRRAAKDAEIKKLQAEVKALKERLYKETHMDELLDL